MKRFAMACLLCLIFCVSAFPQESGLLQCEGDMTFAKAWRTPDGSDLVAELSCGQTLSILGLENGYYKIDIDGIIAYVREKYVKLQPTQKQRKTQPAPTRTPAQPQPSEAPTTTYYGEAARFSLSGMFTWSRSYTGNMYFRPFGSRDYLGWDAAFTGAITKNFALEIDASGNYWLTPTVNYHSISGGPRFIFPGRTVSPYFHFLAGLARGSKGPFVDVPSSGLMLTPGFGMDVSIGERFAFKAFQVDWIILHNKAAFEVWSLTSLRIGGGFAIKF